MAPHSSYDVPRSQRGKFDRQRLDGSVVINVPSGISFTLSAASVASTGMKRLLGEGLRQNEAIYWTTRAGFEGPEIEQIYCDRIDHSRRSTVPHIPSRHADHGSSSTYRLSPRDEPHPYSLRRRRDSDITRRQSSSENIIHYSSYRERARRAGLIYQRFPISDNPESVHITQTSSNILPPPYKSGGSPPPYSSISRSQDYNDGMGPRRSRSGHNSQHRWRRSFPFSWRMR